MARRRFDEAYYARFYEHGDTRVASDRDFGRLGRFVAGYLRYLEQPVETVLDLGCGIGAWRTLITRHFPKASYRGVERSEYLCRRFGWAHGSVIDYDDGERYDLVVCQGVLPYLDAREAKRAIRNLARLCRGALYLQAVTREDWDQACDQERTDPEQHLRPAAWYREAIAPHFTAVGGGLFLSPDSPVVYYSLEALP